ncbi:BlaI/MecI/CopY family transcriptional regulator [Streptomyces sp. NPDC051452]|uniref:BlaI/MecI/CopY family transcriptional regulator n=1 Tax=Streptomyces sp. NPDC051452 TaxID=3365654 RepID=UPI0037B4254E
MPENTAPVTELASHYVNQVAADLDQNVKEQERIAADITALQGQLATLQRDHSVLVSMQQALGVAAPVGTSAEPQSPVVPSPRKKSAAESGKRRATKAAPAARSQQPKKPSAKKTVAKAATQSAAKTVEKATTQPVDKAAAKAAAKTAAAKTAQPTLVELVRAHLAEQSEPRSAAEVAEALGQAHSDREIQTKVVRTTLENLVARNAAQRSKQGSSVFYTVTGSAESTAAVQEKAEPVAAS